MIFSDFHCFILFTDLVDSIFQDISDIWEPFGFSIIFMDFASSTCKKDGHGRLPVSLTKT